MSLLKTINDYLVKEHNPILIDKKSEDDAHIDMWALIHLHEDHFYRGTYIFYECLLHEFVHLDRLRTTGSANGREFPSGFYCYYHPVEREITKEVEQMITQNCLAYRFLKEKLESARFILETTNE